MGRTKFIVREISSCHTVLKDFNVNNKLIQKYFLQESYNLNTSQLAEGVIEEGSKKFDSHYKFSCLDKFHIGVVASNLGWLDTAIEWFDHALNNANPNDKEYTEENIKYGKRVKKSSMKMHDQLLDKKGPVTGSHRTFAVPYDSKLRYTASKKSLHL